MTHLSHHVTHQVSHARPGILRAALLSCSLALATASASAQDVRIFRAPGTDHAVIVRADRDRPMIGVTTAAESERADTLGLRIESVSAGSPAEKAGLKAGDRLQAVNGVSLCADRADAGASDYSGVLNRRLQRAVQAAKPGETVTLRVLAGGASRDVRVTPVKASELEDEATPFGIRMRGPSADRAVLGLSVASTGSVRDTIGVFVQSVVTGGPAEKAGIVEGDRIAAINGVSLRVAREDAEDHAVGAARAERLSREVARLTAGDAVELTVVTAGRTRTVRVTSVKAGDLPDDRMLERRLPEVLLNEGSVAPIMTRRPIRAPN
jgi:serine protease Do